jgi:hypothetical protein
MGGLSMQQSQGFSDFWVANAGQPSSLFLRKLCDLAPQGFDEQGFRQLGKHSLAAGYGSIRMIHRVTKRVFKPFA